MFNEEFLNYFYFTRQNRLLQNMTSRPLRGYNLDISKEKVTELS